MHCELAVPALFAADTGVRLPALEMLLARGRCSAADHHPLEAWLMEAFGIEEDMLPAGALTLAAAGHDPGEASWVRADPIHLRLMRDRLVLAPAPAVALSLQDAQALCEALNRHFAGVLEITPVSGTRWCARLEANLAAEATHPLEHAGRDVDLSAARAERRTQALLNEAQMLLHAHPLNEAREARGELPVNSLWLWGKGRAPRPETGKWHGVVADDPIACGLARLANARHRALPGSAREWLERAPEEGRHLVVLDALRAPFAFSEAAAYGEALERLEKDWFVPLLEALRAGRVGMVSLHVPDAGTSFEAIRGDLRRFWRRPRALSQYVSAPA